MLIGNCTLGRLPEAERLGCSLAGWQTLTSESDMVLWKDLGQRPCPIHTRSGLDLFSI
jgi:hypothetical protein